ncbi:MAG: hypothetical protein Q7R41_07650, partial [Phycisphaerales bacterium]|nr:hypothetical protein [Phycisphaerales bacterium]
MIILLVAGWGYFAYSAWRRWNLMMVGTKENRFDNPGERLRRTFKYAIAQVRMRRYPLAGAAHMLIFLGFGVLLLRTLILWGRGFDESFDFWVFGTDNVIGTVYAFLKDLFAVLVILGTLVFVYYRVVKRLPRMTLSGEGLLILGIILTMMIADILYDGASLARSDAGFRIDEPAGSTAGIVLSVLPDTVLAVLRHLGFWTHSVLVLIFLNLLPYSKHFHVITGIPNIYFQSLKPPGRLSPIEDIDGKLEREETLGIRRINQFSWKSILDFYTCTECGRCSDHCPATKTGKKLSPKHLTLDLRDFLYKHESALVAKPEPRPSGSGSSEPGAQATGGNPPESPLGKGGGENEHPVGTEGGPGAHAVDLVDGVIDPEVLWACTTCR